MLFLPYFFELFRHFWREGDGERDGDASHVVSLAHETSPAKGGKRVCAATTLTSTAFLLSRTPYD